MSVAEDPQLRAYLLERGVHESWLPALLSVRLELRRVLELLARERDAGQQILPPKEAMFSAFRVPADRVRVVIVGQDPYPTPGHAMGLAFGVTPETRPLPGSLRNIFVELSSDCGVPAPATGDLRGWAAQGVLLLNTALSVRAGQPSSHANLGWQSVVRAVLRFLAAGQQPLVAVLWGNHAKKFAPDLAGVPQVAGVHPSPLSAHRGFFGSRPFSRVNARLTEQGAAPIDWAKTGL